MSIVQTSSFTLCFTCEGTRTQFCQLKAFELEDMSDLVFADLSKKYEELVRMTFRGAYKGERTMPQTDNPKDVLSIGQGDPFAAILGGISKAVLQAYGKNVWKGITGPEDSSNYTDYWLWVEPGLSKELEEGLSYDFKIARCKPFPCSGGDFSYGVSIRVHTLSE